jgi:hypothetical protein
MKAGILTSEFWITVAVGGFGAFTAADGDLWTRVLGVALVAIAAVAYIFGRAKVKSAGPQSLTMTAPAGETFLAGKPKSNGGGKK